MNRRPFVRALLASAAVAAAIALAGCDTDGIAPSGRAQAPLSDRMISTIKDKDMDKESPILVRIFKEEAELEVWKQKRDGQYALLKTYPICRWSGDLGPKVKEGDRQAPEGFYNITPGHMNPNSNYYLAFNTGYPNSFDRSLGRTGSELMVHGDCSSRGCYAMTDEQMVEIYALARESFFGGQKSFQLQAYPFRMTALNMAKHRNNQNYSFWKNIKTGYDHFEATKQQPKVDVCEKRYVFDAAAPDNASRPVSFNPKGKCPIYEIDRSVAEAVLERRREEETQTAQYIARGVETVPMRHGMDGGSNPTFAFKLASMMGSNSRLTADASGEQAPGYLPRTTSAQPRATVAESPDRIQNIEAEPERTVVANVPMPRTAPQPKEGAAPVEQPTTIAGLLGIFSAPKTQVQPQQQEAAVEPEEEQPVERKPAQRAEPVKPKAEPKQRVEIAAKPKVETPKAKVEVAQTPKVQSPWPQTATAQSTPIESRWPKPEVAEKPQQPVVRTTSAPAIQQAPRDVSPKQTQLASKPAEPEQPKPRAVEKPRVVEQPRAVEKPRVVEQPRVAEKPKPVEQPRVAEKPRAPEKKQEAEPTMRTAYSSAAPANGLMTGSQPVLAVGTFK